MDREWLVGQGAFLTQGLNHVSWKDSLCKGAGRFSSFRRWQRSFPMSRLRLPFPASPPRHVPWILNIFCQVRVSSDYAFQSVAIFFSCVFDLVPQSKQVQTCLGLCALPRTMKVLLSAQGIG